MAAHFCSLLPQNLHFKRVSIASYAKRCIMARPQSTLASKSKTTKSRLRFLSISTPVWTRL